MDGFFDEIDSILLMLLFLTAIAKSENDTIEKKTEEVFEASIPEPGLHKEEACCIHRSSNRKRLKPRTVYL